MNQNDDYRWNFKTNGKVLNKNTCEYMSEFCEHTDIRKISL